VTPWALGSKATADDARSVRADSVSFMARLQPPLRRYVGVAVEAVPMQGL